LALVYALTLFFDPARTNARNERFTWLPAGARNEADRIEISRGEDKLELVSRNGKWFAFLAGSSEEVPVKQGRVDDLFRLLGTRGAFPHRGSSAASHEALGLAGSAPRLIIRGGTGLPLLDLLVGRPDSSGNEVFLRKNGENEFRSGDRLINTYINSDSTSWYDLKLFEETPLTQVQRVRVIFSGYTGLDAPPPGEDTEGEPPLIGYINYNIARSGENWIMEGDTSPLEKGATEAWIQGILEAAGEDFLPSQNVHAAARIIVELGDGSSRSVQIENPDPEGKALATAGGKPYVFVLPRWTLTRLLRERGYFRTGNN